MTQLSEKELSTIKDLLSEEELLVKKFKMLAEHSETQQLKCKMEDNEYLQIVARSSTPLKYWLIVANAPGIVDADYYNNPDNEGEIFVQVINLSPFTIKLKKGDKIAQGIISRYYTVEDDVRDGERTGGFGSTGA